MKRITVLFQELGHGLLWQRIRIPFARLAQDKWHITYTTFDDVHLWHDTTTDIFVFLHPSTGEELALIQRLREQGKKVVVDIDDLLDNVPSGHPEAEHLLHCKETVPECLQAASAVVTSTPYLAIAYSHLNASLHIVENALSTASISESYVPFKKPYKNMFVAGWVGGQTHRDDQEEMTNGLDGFLERTTASRAHFKAICPQRLITKWGSRVFFDPRTLHYLDYHQWIGTLPWDVCLVPLVPHAFNDAKSDLRFIEMARHKIVCITSPRASFRPHIAPGRLLYAEGPKQFEEALMQLYNSPERLKDMREAAFAYVMQERLDRHAALKWEQVLEGL